MILNKVVSPMLVILIALTISSCQETGNKDTADKTAEYKDLPITTKSEEALKHYQEGLHAMDLGEAQRARPHFDKAIELDPEFAVAYVYRSFTSRSPQEFAADVKMANEKNKDLTEAEKLMVDLDNAYMSGDAEKELSIGKTMVEKYPDVARAHITLGQAYDGMNDHIAARKHFEKAIELNPKWIGGYSALGNSYIFNEPKDFAKAEENMKMAVELMPNESRTHIALGDVYRAQDNLDKALESYNKAMELAPTDPVAFSKAGHANTYLGNYDEARANFKKSGSLSDYPAAELNFTAFTYYYEGKYAEGLAWLKEEAMNLDNAGLSKDRLLSSKTNLLSSCLWTAYFLGDAKQMKEILAILDPLDLENTQNSGSTEAMMQYNARSNNRNGLVAVLDGNLKEAQEFAEAQKTNLASINDPLKLEGYHFLLGEIAMKEGKYADAVTHFEQSDLDDMYDKYMLAMANEKAGNADKASQLWKEISNYNFNSLGYALVRSKVKEMLPT